LVLIIITIIMCVCLVPGLFSTAPSNSTLTPSNSTLTPSNSTEDPLVTLDFDEVGGGCLFLTKHRSNSFYLRFLY
jgi:hypothetical protein